MARATPVPAPLMGAVMALIALCIICPSHVSLVFVMMF
jgi:hypothetical protein